ncbi:hypothetical protein C9439_00555 [archaeon SCG-AAA382B04]|nr:hypothetical protein C9439_00555 [archaeon SCG-AAA382B04]
MSFKVVLFGDLRKRLSNKKENIELNQEEFHSVKDVLDYLDIEVDEVSHIFLDHSYSDVGRKIESENERLALFPKDMALLYKWYFKKKE